MTGACWFDYQYRDAGNWKTFRSLLLSGCPDLPTDADAIRRTLDSGDLFVPEQVGIPVLQQIHLTEHEVENFEGDDLDHAFHEFVGLRTARPDEISAAKPWGSLSVLLDSFQIAGGSGWDVTASPFGRW